MPNKYEFDAVRWCRTMAKAHWQRNEFDISSTFRTVAEEIDRLRAENDTIRNEARVYRKQCDMRDEWRDKIEGELTALKEAMRAKDAGYVALRVAAGSLLSDVDKYYRCADIGDSRDKLAELVGEE